MTYDRWKTDSGYSERDPEDEPSELELVYEQLHQAKEDAKYAAQAQADRIKTLEAALEEALEYFKDKYDVKDGPEGGQLPNEEMRLGQMIDEALYGIRF
jgi:hypothetical protein